MGRRAVNRERWAEMTARHATERQQLRERHEAERRAILERQKLERASVSEHLPPVEPSHVARCHSEDSTRRVTPQVSDLVT